MFSCEFCEISKNISLTGQLWATASKQITPPLQCLQTAKSLISSFSRTRETLPSGNSSNHPLYCNMIRCLFQLNLIFFLSVYIFLPLYYTFRQNQFTAIIHILDIVFIPLIYSCSYLHFLIYTHLLILIYAYLYILFYVLFILLYEFDKIEKIWEIQKLRRSFPDSRVFLVLTMITQKHPQEMFLKIS